MISNRVNQPLIDESTSEIGQKRPFTRIFAGFLVPAGFEKVEKQLTHEVSAKCFWPRRVSDFYDATPSKLRLCNKELWVPFYNSSGYSTASFPSFVLTCGL